MTGTEPAVWDTEQVAITIVGVIITGLIIVDILLDGVDVLSPLWTLVLLFGWLSWLLKLYAQDRIPPLLFER